MKLFETPAVEVIKFAVEDVITTSSTQPAPPPPGGSVGSNCF